MLVERLSQLTRALDGLAEWIGTHLAWLALLMVALGAWNALARWGGSYGGFDLSSNGLIEAQWYAFSVLFLIGAQYTLKRGEHVRVDVFYGRLSARGRAWVDFLGGLLLLLPFCAAALYFSIPGVVESFKIHEQSPDPGGLPRYPLKLMLPVGLALLILQGLSETIKNGLFLFAGKPLAPAAVELERAPEASREPPV